LLISINFNQYCKKRTFIKTVSSRPEDPDLPIGPNDYIALKKAAFSDALPLLRLVIDAKYVDANHHQAPGHAIE
jgi:hypothetical protein